MCNYQISNIGSDQSRAGPWATLAGARDALRKLRADGELAGSAHVEVGAGRHALVAPVIFGPQDGHTTYAAAPGASPVFDGGRVLDGWTQTVHSGRRAWTLDLPEVATGHLYFRSLYVHGQRRPRARLPKFSPDADGVKNTRRLGAMRFPERRELFDGDHVFQPAAGDFEAWPSLRDAEVVLLHYWVETRLPNPHFDPVTGWVTCARRSVFNLYESFNPKLARYYIDNLFEALTEPGEWYLDRTTGRLTYLPLPEETIANTQIVAPLVDTFIDAAGHAFNQGSDVGDPLGTRLVERLSFNGLTFRHSDWYQPSSGMLPHNREAARGIREIPLGSAPQAAAHIPAVVSFKWARQCRFDHCTVEHTGFSGLEFGPGCRDCSATHNTFQHLGGGGAKVGGSDLDGALADRTADIRVTDNVIRHIGRVFHQSVGILLTNAFRCDLLHNEIAHTCYSGISVGWSWGYRETITRDIRIEGNLIHDICEGVLSDNGGIYLLGVQPGTVVRGNHLYRVTCADYGGWGIYPDEGSSHLLIEHNWVHDTQGPSLNIHFGRENVVRDNVFARCGENFVGVGRVENHIAATVLHNVMLGPAIAPYGGGYTGDIRNALRTDANLFWFPGQAFPPPSTHPTYRKDVPHQISWEEWQSAGHDRLSLFADPGVTENASSLIFPPDSPALRLGFRPFDWSTCGPRPIV